MSQSTLINVHGASKITARVDHFLPRAGGYSRKFSTLDIEAGGVTLRLFMDDSELAQRVKEAIAAAAVPPVEPEYSASVTADLRANPTAADCNCGRNLVQHAQTCGRRDCPENDQ